ncbi:uncharacterized protein DC041_0002652 [Schistosoma bovis]|uniref:Ion transport N-terminal domain-containing protein n=1 Tax=Schistosoma bovis TaxID=6184 RepID=A0A430QFJ1_SCHBO|nr:uncharacterized protein DC041_0002652 [Schistosoma bovis]
MNRKLLSFQTSTINDTNDITFNRPSEICELQNLNSNEHMDDMNDIPTKQKMEMPEPPENIKVSRETSDKKLSAGKNKSNNMKKLNNKLRFRYYSVGLLNSLHLLTANSNCNIDTTNKMYTPIKHLKQPRARRYTINLPEENDELQSLTFNDAASYMDIGGDNSILNEIEEPLSLDTKTPCSHQRQSVINNNINNKSGFRERGWSLYNLKEQFISFFQPSDNKLALKLFGNKVALACEKRRQREQGYLESSISISFVTCKIYENNAMHGTLVFLQKRVTLNTKEYLLSMVKSPIIKTKVKSEQTSENCRSVL